MQLYREGLCPVCGGPAAECQAPETFEDAKFGRYTVEHSMCLRTFQLRKAMAAASESSDEPSALVFTTRLRGDARG